MHADVRSLECSLWWVVLAHGMWGGGGPSRPLLSSLGWFYSHLAFIHSFSTFIEHQLHTVCDLGAENKPVNKQIISDLRGLKP